MSGTPMQSTSSAHKPDNGVRVLFVDDSASVRLAYRRDASPAYRVNVHLVTPGPDVFAEGCDHTLRAAFGKMMTALKNKLSGRDAKRLCRLKSNLQSTPSQSRNGRRG